MRHPLLAATLDIDGPRRHPSGDDDVPLPALIIRQFPTVQQREEFYNAKHHTEV